MTTMLQLGRMLLVSCGVALAATAVAQQPVPPAKTAAKKPAAPAVRTEIEPRAMELLKAMSARLAAAKTMSFTAAVGYEFPSRYGPPIIYTTRYHVAMQRPNQLRIVTPGDGPSSEFYFDGKTMTAFAPIENLAAVAAAPATIEAALVNAYATAKIYYPFSDLLVDDPFAALTRNTVLAFYVGRSGVVGGTPTDMVVWANSGVFVQIWIGVDDKLPRRIRAIFQQDPQRLRHEMDITNWQLDQPIPPETFAVAARIKDAGRMPFAGPAAPAGAKPIIVRDGAKPKAPAAPAKSN